MKLQTGFKVCIQIQLVPLHLGYFFKRRTTSGVDVVEPVFQPGNSDKTTGETHEVGL
jgi:hypothetical protein